MTRLSWRQMRWAAISTASLLVALVVVVVATRSQMTTFLRTSGLSQCLSQHGDCTAQVAAFVERFSPVLSRLGALNFVPLLIGVFWGAPMVAREVEQGTHRLVWTQSISSTRWFAVKTAVLAAAAILVALVVTGLFTWWSQPFFQIGAEGYSRVNPSFHPLQGTVPVASALFAFAVGVAASALIRRTVPAMAVATAAFFVPWLLLQQLRAELLAPQVLTYPIRADNPRCGLGDWKLHPESILDRLGHPANHEAMQALCPADAPLPPKGIGLDTQCLAEHGFQMEYVYQPLTRFWPLQAVESGILLAAAALLLATAAWWTTRRIS